MKRKIIIFILSMPCLLVNGMQKTTQNATPEEPQDPRQVILMKSFKMKQLEQLKEKDSELKAQLVLAAERKNNKNDVKAKKVQQYPYSGPQVFDIIGSNCSVVNNRFALADQDECATVFYPAQSPFNKIMSLRAQAAPFGINALVANKQQQIATDAGNQIIVWDIEEQEQIATLKGHIDIVSSLSFNPTNPNILASGSYDTTIKLWDLRKSDNRCVATLQDTDKIYSVSYSPTVEQLVSVNASKNQALGLWFIINKQKVGTAEGSWTAQYNNAGQNIIAGLPGQVVLYNAENLEVIKSLELPGDWSKNNAIPGAFDFSPDGAQVVVSGPLQDIFIFNSDLSGNPIDIQSGMLGVDSHWIGNNILSSAYGCAFDGGPYVRIWDVAQAKRIIEEKLKREQDNAPKIPVNSDQNTSGCEVQ